MLEIGGFQAGSCRGVSRRAFLRLGSTIPFAAGSLAAATAHAKPPRAKSTVFVWLWGAPSHLDTFDPKPDAPTAYRGPFTTIETKTPGLRFTELVPKLAARSDRFSLVRSNITHAGGHPDAGTLGMTGYKEGPGPVEPSFGSIVARHHGQRDLPPYLMLGRGVPRDVVRAIQGYGGGDWGKAYDPFMVDCGELGHTDVPALKLLEGLSPERMADRRSLSAKLDEVRRGIRENEFDQWDDNSRRAFSLLTSRSAVQALDLSQEDEKTRAAYGQTSFGQSLLLARRMVEAEVPYIHVNWSEFVEAFTPNTDFGWDTHIHNFDLLPNRHCPIFDRAFSAFLDDLYDRGLIDSTLVACMGEFGRTPKINRRAARDHWPQCYFSLWAGGGIKPGRVVGASDRLAENPVSRPIEPSAVGATIMDAMGVDSVARAELNVLRGGEVIHELY
ncbi:MAG: DUF1501 domain-containing protein [Planctomycetota bacterium]